MVAKGERLTSMVEEERHISMMEKERHTFLVEEERHTSLVEWERHTSMARWPMSMIEDLPALPLLTQCLPAWSSIRFVLLFFSFEISNA